jgi:REP element-mobilizing transposase RayT
MCVYIGAAQFGALGFAYSPGVPRRPRSLLGAYGVFHVTARGVAGNALFRDDVDRFDFISQLARSAMGFLWTCHVYCLMTTHYHLLIESSQESLSLGMQRLNGLYAQRFNGRHGRRGHLFEQRFQAYVLKDEKHFEEASRYILENPVKAGLCERADDWPWSGGLLHQDVTLDRTLAAVRRTSN